jgi:Tol biopolymer transport system component
MGLILAIVSSTIAWWVFSPTSPAPQPAASGVSGRQEGATLLISTIDLTSADSENSEVYSVSTVGEATQLTFYDGPDHSPTWSPGHDAIAFVSDRDEAGNIDIYTMGSDGSGVKRLTSSEDIDSGPSWSPRGDVIAFERTDDTGKSSIFIVGVISGEEERLSPVDVDAAQPAWSPDGDELAFAVNEAGALRVLVLTLANGETRELKASTDGVSGPEWSPAGDVVTVEVQDQGETANQLVEVAAQGGRVLGVLVPDTVGVHIMATAWSAMGDQLAYTYVTGSDSSMTPHLAIYDFASSSTIEIKVPGGQLLPLIDW